MMVTLADDRRLLRARPWVSTPRWSICPETCR